MEALTLHAFSNAELEAIKEEALHTQPSTDEDFDRRMGLVIDLARALHDKQETIDRLGACILTQ